MILFTIYERYFTICIETQFIKNSNLDYFNKSYNVIIITKNIIEINFLREMNGKLNKFRRIIYYRK